MAMKDCIEHLYSWDYTIQDAYGCPRCVERERIINDLKDQFAFVMECETKEGLQIQANSIYWSERWQLTFNDLIALIKGEK